ncbi:uncharacterized protein [Rutidosis leptorrhynchoides]|uniref:uncharacterized protein n=1 Tax=Rutidosis leptorrhynchoides TaxID=125765 RepID=UPI003A99B480
MELSVSRSLMKTTSRQFINTFLQLKQIPPQTPSQFHICRHHIPLTTLSLSSNPKFSPNSKPSLFTQSSIQSIKSNFNPPISNDCFARIASGDNSKSFEWKYAIDNVNDAKFGCVSDDKLPIVTVVLLGWLGSQQKHLRRYAEMYNSLGMNAILFAASVNDLLGFDLGKKIESKLESLSNEIVLWLEKIEIYGRERFMIFHTFSNTGWLAYGHILNLLQGRKELLDKIKGCVVDSGGAPELDPKIFAAGFTTAMLKKKSSSINSSGQLQNGVANVNTEEKGPSFKEVVLLTMLEKFFNVLLEFPDIRRRLIKVTSTLSNNQPCHPQLYLYSTADKVIPFQSIESFAEHQKSLGRKVTKFNFVSTPHVDHYRTFPDKYRSLIQNFLKDCFSAEISNCAT